jgi:hypothetical protein
VRARIADRFGLVPEYFMMARAEPPIVESMFSMVEFTYFDAPLPSLFKERDDGPLCALTGGGRAQRTSS